jgi:heat-inducible transcriptional repressor
MRTLSEFDQEDRKRKLLQAVIHEYIKTGKPVGSAHLASIDRLDLSSATLRNVMAELEEEGFLMHPHTSAGRVPTDKAYRFYVDTIMEVQRLAQMEEDRIRKDYEARLREIEGLMTSTSRTLSVLSKYTGFIWAPGLERATLQHLELIPLDPRRILAVLVSDSGMVKHRQVTFDRPVPSEVLADLRHLLNEELRGKPFSEARDTFLEHVEGVTRRRMDLADVARQLAKEAFSASADEGDLYMEGAGAMLSLPDFQTQEDLRSLAHLLDGKNHLSEMIAKEMENPPKSQGVVVRIGSENKSPDLQNLSLVSSSYTVNGRQVGLLGILGPRRMEYSRMVAVVDAVSRLVSQAMERMIGHERDQDPGK